MSSKGEEKASHQSKLKLLFKLVDAAWENAMLETNHAVQGVIDSFGVFEKTAIGCDSEEITKQLKLALPKLDRQTERDRETEGAQEHKLNCYLALKCVYKLAEYLFMVKDTKQRQILHDQIQTE